MSYSESKMNWFNGELNRLAGTNLVGLPLLRVVWGGNCPSDISADSRLKYRVQLKVIPNWFYDDPVTKLPVRITSFDIIQNVRVPRAPENCIPYETAPDFEEIGWQRYIIEQWQSPEQMIAKGRDFADAVDPKTGVRIKRDLPREGVYDYFFVVETVDGEFRDLDAGVLEYVKKFWAFEKLPMWEKVRLGNEWQIEQSRKQKEKEDAVFDGFGDWKLSKEEKERIEEADRTEIEELEEMRREITRVSVSLGS